MHTSPHIYIHIHVCLPTYKHIYMHTYICTHECVCMHSYLHVCIHTFTHIQRGIHTYICIYMDTYLAHIYFIAKSIFTIFICADHHTSENREIWSFWKDRNSANMVISTSLIDSHLLLSYIELKLIWYLKNSPLVTDKTLGQISTSPIDFLFYTKVSM